jgi:hypothetical protein
MRHRHALAAVATLGFLLAIGADPARAEPYFMVRAGAKCNDCHTNLTGGGKRTPFAHIHARDILHDLDLLPVPPAVKGFNGQLHEYVSIGGDLRLRNTTIFQDRFSRSGSVPRNRAYRRSTTSNDFDVNESLLYLQVDLLPEFITVYNDFNVNGGVTNRETFGLIRGFLPYDTYVKAGRFFPTFGLRVQDDEAFVRSRSGYTFTNPDEGVELGFAPGPFFLATSVTNGTGGDKDVAATVNGYGVFQDIPVVKNILAGASYGRQTDKRWVAGFYAGSNLWRFTYLAEFDVIDDRTVGSRAARDQYAAYAELNFLAFEWLNLRGTFDFVKVSRAQDQTRYAIGAEPFVNRFIQPRVQYRINNGPPRPGAQPNELVENQAELIFELHFFF